MTTHDRYTVFLTKDAADDIAAIHQYLMERGALVAADRLVMRFAQRIEALESFPARGVVPRELSELGITDVRQSVLSPHRIFYRIAEQSVLILLIADGRRDLMNLLRQRLTED